MAKVPFSKFGTKVNAESCEFTYINAKGEEIKYEVIKYLPFAEKLTLISKIINQSTDDNGFYNPMRVKLYLTLETVFAYTNLSFTDKMKEDIFKLYDNIMSTDIFSNILTTIGDSEWSEIQEGTWSTIKNIYDYKNSIMGILEMVSSDYSNMEFDAMNIKEALGDANSLGLLRDIMTKLG